MISEAVGLPFQCFDFVVGTLGGGPQKLDNVLSYKSDADE